MADNGFGSVEDYSYRSPTQREGLDDLLSSNKSAVESPGATPSSKRNPRLHEISNMRNKNKTYSERSFLGRIRFFNPSTPGGKQTVDFASFRFLVTEDDTIRNKSPCGFLTSLITSTLLVIGYFVLFTNITGRDFLTLNRETFKEFGEDFEEELNYMLIISGVVIVGLIICDLQNGPEYQKKIFYSLFLIALIGLVSSLSFISRNLAVIPLIMYLITAPVAVGILKYLFFSDMDRLMYLLGILCPIWLGFTVSCIINGIHVPNFRWREPAVQAIFMRQAGCDLLDNLEPEIADQLSIELSDENLELFNSLDTAISRAFNKLLAQSVIAADEEGCEFRGLVLYHGFTIYIVLSFILIWIMFELMRATFYLRKKRELSNLSIGFQIFLLMFSLVVFAAWIVTLVIPEDNGNPLAASTLLLLFVGVVAGIGAFLVGNVLSVDYIIAQLNRTPIGKRVYQSIDTDIVKAAVVYFASPVFFIWALVTLPTQFVRKYTFLGKKITHPAEKESHVIKEVYKAAKTVYLWDLGWILHKCLLIGLIYFVVAVFIGKFTTFILAVSRQVLGPASLAVSSIAFVIIGLSMFLLPPVPGLPVYLFGGVILFTKAETEFSVGIAILYAIIVNLFLKLLAVAVEQKIIGEYFGSKSRSIKSQVGINEKSIKAIGYILSSKGNYVAKVAILCGGPDWPTSVLTGILRLPLLPMLCGTLPVIVLVSCATAAGVFLVYLGDAICPDEVQPINISDCEADLEPEELITSLRAVLLGLMIIIQAILFLLAFHCIAKTVDEKPEEIAKLEDDEDVRKYEEENKERFEKAQEFRSWKNLPTAFKILHVLMVFLIITSNWALQFGGEVFFEVVEPTDDPVFPIKQAGFSIIGLISLPIIYFFFFNYVIKKRVNIALADEEEEERVEGEGNNGLVSRESADVDPSDI